MRRCGSTGAGSRCNAMCGRNRTSRGSKRAKRSISSGHTEDQKTSKERKSAMFVMRAMGWCFGVVSKQSTGISPRSQCLPTSRLWTTIRNCRPQDREKETQIRGSSSGFGPGGCGRVQHFRAEEEAVVIIWPAYSQNTGGLNPGSVSLRFQEVDELSLLGGGWL
jgi:hypothetical protein